MVFIRFGQSRRAHKRSRGQSLVELALIAPVFLILLATAIDLGRLMYSQIVISNAAKEGALVASQGGTFQSNSACSPTNAVMCGVLTEAKGGFVEVDQARVTLTPATCVKDAMYPAGGPPNVSVKVTAPFKLVTPLIGSILGSNLTLNAEADAQCLVVPVVTYPSVPAPNAAFTTSTNNGPAPLDVSFDASSSSAVGATITDYTWSFGTSGATTTHQFATAGTYTVVLTVTDSRGQTDTATATITATGAGGGGPTPTPPCPTVDFTATADKNKPRKFDFDGSVSDGSAGWNWNWTGDITANGQSIKNYDFVTGGTKNITLTASKTGCTIFTTKQVVVP
jgi:PKD repeat protein